MLSFAFVHVSSFYRFYIYSVDSWLDSNRIPILFTVKSVCNAAFFLLSASRVENVNKDLVILYVFRCTSLSDCCSLLKM